EGATKFDISIFDTGRVTTMYQMFYNCSLAKTIVMSSKFTTSNISGTQLHEIFRNCNSLETLDLSSFDTSRLSTGEYFFYNCARLKHLTFGPSFTMENATTLTHMFDSCDSLEEIDITMFNTARVTDMSYMFSGCASLTELNLSSFDTSNVTTMWNMFSRCPGLTSVGVSTSAIQYSLNLGTNFDTSKVTDMSGMFAYCSGITEIHLGDKFNTGNVTNMGSMFFSCSALREATVINTFDITKVKDLSSLFGFCASLTEIDLSRFVINPGVVIVGIVDACTSLERIHCPTINHEKLSAELPTIYKANTTTYRQISQETNRKVLDRAGNFIYTSFRVILGEELCQKVATITITSKLSQSVITRGKFVNADQMEMASIGGVFSVGTANTLGTLYSNTSLLKAYMLRSDYVDENGDMMYDCVIYSRDMIVYAPENSEYLFAGNDGYNSYFTRLRNVYLDGFDTSNAKSFKGMFANCEELRYLDISGLKNSLVENYDNMLLNCRKLVYIYTFNSNDYEIELPGAYFLKNSTSTDEIRTFPVRATELSKRFSMVLDISTAENFVAEGWTVTNDGTTAEKVFSYGAAVGALPTLRHGDRVFNGWGTIEDDVFVPYNFDPTKIYEVNEDIVLVPSWAQVYVTFDFRDGYVDVAHVLHATETEEKEYISELNQTTVTAEHAVFVEKEIPAGWTSKFDGTKILMYAGDAFGDFPSVLKDDYELLGWKTIDGEFALSNLSVPVDETAEAGQIGEVVLYADWIFAENPERWRFITFDANGGRIDAYRSVYVSTTVISEYDEELGDYKSVTKLVLDVENSNPQWDISGSRSQTTKKYYVGRLYDIMPYSVNSGYRFAGWWTQRDGGQLLESTASISDSATVYAHWEQIDENY
ncbi:MAG: BspA family leucine-rich repeat surface protein, partial [Clostridia bacterium]|nr:BspA family leucine-rich repeat surface protein [Clostridia bacterium]